MAHNTMIDGTITSIGGGCLVNGTKYSIQNGRTLIDGTGYNIEFGQELGQYQVGNIIPLNENGVATDYIIVHQGIPGGSGMFGNEYDASCNGTWLLRKDIIEKRIWNENQNTYASSSINIWLNEEMLSKYDIKVQNSIKQVKIPYCLGGSSATVQQGFRGLSCKIFLLSGREVGFPPAVSSMLPNEGEKLDYFLSAMSSSDRRIAYLNGEVTAWWLRSPFTSTANIRKTDAWFIQGTGASNSNDVDRTYGIRPALILPSEFKL